MEFIQYEKKFGNVSFKNLSSKPSSIGEKVSAEFYDELYQEYYKNINTYDDLPERYKNIKNNSANILKKYISGGRILSYGCGNGFIETQCLGNFEIDCFDFSEVSTRFIPKEKLINIEDLESWSGDTIFCIQLVYALSKDELEKFFQFANNSLKKEGLLIITHSSAERGVKSLIKWSLKNLKILLLERSAHVKWGWRRYSSLYVNFAQKNGFSIVAEEINPANNETFLILKKN